MSCDHLICARCSHPVSEGRCPTCRAAREEFHAHGFAPSPALVLTTLVLLLTLSLILAVRYGTY